MKMDTGGALDKSLCTSWASLWIHREAVWQLHNGILRGVSIGHTPSRKRLVPFQVPSLLSYPTPARPSPIAIPWVNRQKALNVEVRTLNRSQISLKTLQSVCVSPCTRVCYISGMHAFSFHALTRPCETVMWALKFNNFRGIIGDRDLKSTRPFPQ